MSKVLEQALVAGREKLLAENPYFKLLHQKTDVRDFERMCIDLYHLSGKFLDAITIRYERFKDAPEEIFRDHMEEETGHAEMLRKWMLLMGMVDPKTVRPSIATEKYISMIFRAATTMDKNLSLLVINGAGEGTAQDFYMETYKHFKSMGYPKLNYWYLHAEVDQAHGDIIKYLSEMEEHEIEEALHYIEVTLNTIAEMKASWLSDGAVRMLG
jgi:hypothetical protein